MEFDFCIERVKRVLLGAANTSHEPTDEGSFQKLYDDLRKCMSSCPEGYELRNIYMFILLNGDANFVDSIAEDQDFAHLIDTIPRLSQKLTLRLILNCGGLFFIKELIAFGPSAVSISVMETIYSTEELHHFRFSSTFARDLSKACFYKLTHSQGERWTNLEKIYGFFEAWQADFRSTHMLSEDNEVIQMMVHNVEIALFMFERDIADIGKCWPIYLLMCKNNSENNTVAENEIHKKIIECFKISILSNQHFLEEVTFFEWLDWSQKCYNQSDTYQQYFGRLAWKLKVKLEEQIENPEYDEIPVRQLASVLSSFSTEPKDDEERFAGIDEIKLRLSDENSKTEKWMKAFLQHSDVKYDEETLSLIEANSTLLDKDDVEFILNRIVASVRDKSPCDKNSLRCLCNLIMKNLSLENMKAIYRNYIDKYATSSDLCDSEFTSHLQAAFNKTCFDSEECSNEWQKEILCLSVFHPSAVIQKSLSMGIQNEDVVKFMASILQMLKPLSKEEALKWLSDIHIKHALHDSEMKLFPKFGTQLVIHEVLSFDEMFRHIIFGIEKAIQCYDWPVIYMWVVTMQELLKEIHRYNYEGGSVAELILFLGQLLEFSEQSVAEHLQTTVSTRSQVLLILKDLLRFEVSESDKQKLRLCIKKFSVMTKYHLGIFCVDHFSTYITTDCDLILNLQESTPECAAYVLAELISFLTHEECRELAAVLERQFENQDDCGYSIFQTFSAAIALLIAACSDIDFNSSPNHVACLNYSITCLGVILKNVSEPALATQNYLRVLEETFYLLSKMPSQIWNRSVLDLLPILVVLMKQLEDDSFCSLLYILSTCPVSEGRSHLQNQIKSLLQDSTVTGEEDLSDR
ncbi:hypothetical protein ONE63_001274 [Megalurothrips usitatus]|uniref:Gem-associated protein 4 n=1 Tax=Megalurothrips usitatus TaxID=439358 RepID=A0AAV7XBP2_9NEOP|nr:hypothetical protein ONE63_001274 [Megalurothrips usitatus]